MSPERIVELARAKVNLHLEVTGRRPDGYHELETVMAEVDLADELVLEAAGDEVTLDVSDPSVGVGEDNLAVRAVRAVEARVGRALPCRMRLEKRIPAGGGLGGGSSDAAAAIRAVDRAHGLGLGCAVQEEIAATVGSDVAFFVRGGVSLCTGRGEVVSPISCPRSFPILLVFPGVHVPTASIYRALTLTGSSHGAYDCVSHVESGDVSGLRRSLFNRLENVALGAFPELAELRDRLATHAPLMSGSGSTFFVLCDDEDDLRRRMTSIERETGLHVVPSRTTTR